MHPHAALVTRFYERFRALDAEGMAACYHPEATFRDPVFPDLRGEEVPRMWRMLVAGARDLEVRLVDVRAEGNEASARWEARYSFGKARRRVHNVVDARFAFRDGLIVRHVDSFDLWRWSRMALGAPGALLGWAPPFHAKIRQDAARRLAAYGTRVAPTT